MIGPRASRAGWYRVESPQEVPVTCIERIHVPGYSDVIATRVADEHAAADCEGRHRNRNTGCLRIDAVFPQLMAIGSRQGDDVAVGSASIQRAVKVGETAIDAQLTRRGAGTPTKPLQAAVGRIDGAGAGIGSEIQRSRYRERSCLERRDFGQFVAALEP